MPIYVPIAPMVVPDLIRDGALQRQPLEQQRNGRDFVGFFFRRLLTGTSCWRAAHADTRCSASDCPAQGGQKFSLWAQPWQR